MPGRIWTECPESRSERGLLKDEGGADTLVGWAFLRHIHGLLVSAAPQHPIAHLLWKHSGFHREILGNTEQREWVG